MGYGRCLAPFLRVLAGIGARSIDQGHHGETELLRQLGKPHRFAISLGASHPETAFLPLFESVALLMADQDDPSASQRSQTADDRLVIPMEAVPLQLQEVRQRV